MEQSSAEVEKKQRGEQAKSQSPSIKQMSREESKQQAHNEEPQSQKSSPQQPYPTMTMALFLYWVLPIVLLSLFGRRGLDIPEPRILLSSSKTNRPDNSIAVDPRQIEKAARDYETQKKKFEQTSLDSDSSQAPSVSPSNGVPTKSTTTTSASPQPQPQKVVLPTAFPTHYRSTVKRIQRRRPRWHHGPLTTTTATETSHATKTSNQPESSKKSTTPHTPKTTSQHLVARDQSPERVALRQQIEALHQKHQTDPTNVFVALDYANAMRRWGLTFFDGGSYDQEAIRVYTHILNHLLQEWRGKHERGESTRSDQLPAERLLPPQEQSMDALLCTVFTALGKLYFMANMFEKSEEAYTNCLEAIEPGWLDAVNQRGSTRIVLNKYKEAAQDYKQVIQEDHDRSFSDAYAGLVRVLGADETALENGWDFLVQALQASVTQFEAVWDRASSPHYQSALADGLRRFHHGLFVYHDMKSKDYDTAWFHLTESHKYKLKLLTDYPVGTEHQRARQVESVFGAGFWPLGMGSPNRTPIFVIGFARSGSTLLERILDAHPDVAGLGENSVFNGKLDSIRQRLVEASSSGRVDVSVLAAEMAEEVVQAMEERWGILNPAASTGPPLRLVDKMLANYFNVGFIHMLFPQALILHVMREPMDTLWSSFKHDFPGDRLAYTGNPQVLVELYSSYRDVMKHWERVLPGRITHVRYEDLVQDLPGVARSLVVDAAGLPWNESVLEFHKKKHFVNTYSTTQVQKKVYKDAIQAWKRYESHLGPLKDLVGAEYLRQDQRTTLPNYQRLASTDSHDEL